MRGETDRFGLAFPAIPPAITKQYFITEKRASIATYLVSGEGDGDFMTIQTAVNTLKANREGGIIFIKDGTYNQNVTIDDDYVTLMGSGRGSIISGNITITGNSCEICFLKVTGTLLLQNSDSHNIHDILGGTIQEDNSDKNMIKWNRATLDLTGDNSEVAHNIEP